MKEQEISTHLASGHILFRGRFLLSKAERINYRDKKTGQSATMDKLTHTVFSPDGVKFVEQDTRAIPGFNPEGYRSPIKENQPVIVIVSAVKQDMGITTIRGALHPVEP